MSVTLRIEGLQEALRGLDPAKAARAAFLVRRGVAEEVRAAIAIYPGSPKYPLRWASAKQKRWFFVAARQGRIQVPYVRQFALKSERLGGWGISEDARVVGTRVKYAPYVQSAERQQPFHKDTGWKTDQQAVDEVRRSGAVERILRDVAKIFKGG